jgi:phospholipid/cholesterol/gamma-HCH transport system permease protein
MEGTAELTVIDSTVRCSGHWTARHIHDVEQRLPGMNWPLNEMEFDLSGVTSMDTSGAWLLFRTMDEQEQAGKTVRVCGADKQASHLLAIVGARSDAVREPPRPYVPGYLENIGAHVVTQLRQYRDLLTFVGNLAVVVGRTSLNPRRVRVGMVVRELELAGLNALPIVGLLAFLVGVVIAYQGGVVLRDYGATLYIADIVGLATIRELAPLITAIIVAGRTGSAYTAQIGTMVVTEEVDALRSIGIPPMEILVLPKLIALIIALPLLTVFADFLGLLGGMVMANTMLGLNPTTYIGRLAEALTISSYLSGIGKAPVFAVIIATVGCFRGFQVFGSAESVGRQTTISVVESIFLVLIVDAAFSVAFSQLGI